MALQDSDLLVVGRNNQPYKIEYSTFKNDLNSGLDLSAYVKLNDGGTKQTIAGGGGLEVSGAVTGTVFNGNLNGTSATLTGNVSANLFQGNVNASTVVATTSVTTAFGTSSAQQGNVAPLNDWSVYPART